MSNTLEVRLGVLPLRDPFVWLITGAGLLLLVPSFVPLLSEDALQTLNERWSDLVLLALLLPPLLAAARAGGGGTRRRFWLLVAAGIVSFTAVEVLEFAAVTNASTPSLVKALLFVGLYVFVALALELKPHAPRAELDRWRWRRRLEASGVVVLGLGLLVYFTILPEWYGADRASTARATSLLYSVFDTYLIVRLLQLRRSTSDRGWRTTYILLAAAFAFWLAADAAEVAFWSAWLPEDPFHSLLDLVWLPPFVALVLAARTRRNGEVESGLPPSDGAEESASAWAPWRRPLWLQAVALPLVHYGLGLFGALEPRLELAQRHCAALTFLALAGLALLDQKRVEAEAQRLAQTARQARDAELRAHHDPLTGLPNRYLLFDHLKLALARARRQDTKVAIAYLDLDRFKVVNTALGHVEADKVLLMVAERLRTTVRASDTVGRIGGDEFVIVATELTQPADALRVAEKLLESLRRPLTVGGIELFVTASAGLTLFPDDGESAEDLLRRADRAMMRAKDQGGDRLLREEFQYDSGALAGLDLETALRKGISDDAFVLRFQPIYDLGSERVRACEALLRWNHPLHGLQSPGEFLDTAESIGVLSRLTPWLLATACRKAALWPDEAVSVAVNLSARQFLDPHLSDHIDRALEASGLPGSRLQLEITENVAMAHPERMAPVLERVRSAGVTIAVDDFGTGHSSLAILRHLPIDTLKIDAAFVRDLGGSEASVTLIEAILAMAEALGLAVVAEGVERPEQLARLRQLGCRYAQGFLLAPPLDNEALNALFAENRVGGIPV